MAVNIKDLRVTSTSFAEMERIPERHTGLGKNISPELVWSGVPKEARSLAIVCHDPDAPLPDGYTHWVLTGIPVDLSRLPEGGGAEYTQGANDAGEPGYRGPMPPPGHGDHRYYFWLYALSVESGEPVDRRGFIDRYGPHVIEQARTVGVFRR